MKRFSFAALALIVIISLSTNSARAQASNNSNGNALWAFLNSNQDPRLWTPGMGLGIATSVASYFLTEKHGNPGVRTMTPLAAYGVTTAGCMVVYPFLGTIVLNRPMTYREVYVGMANCIVPIIGGWLVDHYLPHTVLYDGGPPPKKARRHKS